MKSPLLLTLALGPLACAGAGPATVGPQSPSVPPVVVDLTPPPAAMPPAPKAEPPAPIAEAKPDPAPGDPAQFGILGLIGTSADDPNAPKSPWGAADKGNLWGADVGESFGAGGLGLSGVGGSGGTGASIGLGTIGGGGNGGRPSPKIRMGTPTVAGRLPPEVIQRIVRQNLGRFRLCYENALRNMTKLEGRITVKFVIDPHGSIASVEKGGSTLPDPSMVNCVTRAFQGLSFPEPEAGQVVVLFPIDFSPADPPAPSKAPAPAAPPKPAPATRP